MRQSAVNEIVPRFEHKIMGLELITLVLREQHIYPQSSGAVLAIMDPVDTLTEHQMNGNTLVKLCNLTRLVDIMM